MSNGDNVLSVANITKLTTIFQSNKWPFADSKEYSTLFIDFCALLSNLSIDEQELVLILTEDFLRVTYFDYLPLMEKVLLRIDNDLIEKADQIFILPLISPRDKEKGVVKSSHNMLYNILHQCINRHTCFRNAKRKTSVLVDMVKMQHDRRNALLIFVDDYIGSGLTACEAMWDYWMSYRVESDSVVIIALVAQDKGIYVLNKHLFNHVYAEHIRRRGISDSDKFADINTPLDIMDQIERRLKIKKKCRRGFAKSEALVTMIRTPNNTFPVYWCSETKKRKPWPAPFKRY